MIDQGVRMGDGVAVLELNVTQAALAAADVMCAPVEIEQATMKNGTSTLMSVALVDYDDQGGDIDLVFFDADPGDVGAPNATVLMNDDQAALLCGFVTVDTYSDVGNQQIATIDGIGLAMHPHNGTSLWMVPICRTAQCTYTSGRLTVKLGLLRS